MTRFIYVITAIAMVLMKWTYAFRCQLKVFFGGTSTKRTREQVFYGELATGADNAWIKTFRPGLWAEYVLGLERQAEAVLAERKVEKDKQEAIRKAKDISFKPIDDSSTFRK
jgi:hypothetical protein